MRCYAALALVVAVLAVSIVTSNETTADVKEDLAAMSKEQLVHALQDSRAETQASKKDAKAALDKVGSLKDELNALTDDDMYEHNRKANEKDMKDKEKKKESQKKTKKLKKETKFSDAMMEHAAEYLSMKVAKKTADKGSTIQKAVTLEAARQAGRAGAVNVLKKVFRSAAVAAVKSARVAAKKAGKTEKHEIRKVSVQAAKDAVNKLLKEQDELVEGTAQKYYELAIKKYPPSAFLAEDDGKPNVFTAPPSIHLGFDTPEKSEVLEEAPAKRKGTKKAKKKGKKGKKAKKAKKKGKKAKKAKKGKAKKAKKAKKGKAKKKGKANKKKNANKKANKKAKKKSNKKVADAAAIVPEVAA